MSAFDDLHGEMGHRDDVFADALLDGRLDPADAPAGYRNVALLIRSARGPRSPAELASEPETVPAMVAVVGDAMRAQRRDTYRRTGTARVVRRAVAAKVVAAVVIGAFGLAAAATTGVVVAIVTAPPTHDVPLPTDWAPTRPPGASPRRELPALGTEQPPAEPVSSDLDIGPDSHHAPATVTSPDVEPPQSDDGSSQVEPLADPNATPPAPAERAPDGDRPTAETIGDTADTVGSSAETVGAPTEDGASPPESEAPGVAPTGSPPGPEATPPGHGGSPPGLDPTPPGLGATPPGQGGSPPGRDAAPPGTGDESPGQSGEPPGHVATPPDHPGTKPDPSGLPGPADRAPADPAGSLPEGA